MATECTRRPFEADIQRLLHLIIRSVYSNKDVFLRELISNASDAIDKVRILKMNAEEGSSVEYGIRVRVLEEEGAGGKILEIEDDGVGMDEEDLVKNLSTIAHSGTHDFLETIKDTTSDMSQLIGQFGVGFYASYLVASTVQVITKKWKENRVLLWESDGASSYEIRDYEGTDFTIEHGTRIRLFLKDEEYATSKRLEEIVKQHNQFISYPILLWKEKEKVEEIPKEETIEEEDVKEGDAVVEDVKEGETPKKEDAPKTRVVKYEEWEQVNGAKPLWYRQPSEITDEEYVELYKSLGTRNRYEMPIHWRHFKAEGKHEFQGIFYFVPESRMRGAYGETPETRNIRLYVKKVLIMEHCGKELIPEWMGFITGIVDSNDLQLNVSREMLQSDAVVKSMKKYIQKQVLKMLGEFFEKDREKYLQFYKQNHKHLKWGLTQGEKGVDEYLLFRHSKNEEEWISFQEYVDKSFVEGQKQIFYVTGDKLEDMKSSIFMERFVEKGIDVLYMDDPIDEFVMQELPKFKDFETVNVSKDFESDLFKDPASTENDDEEKSKEKEEDPATPFFHFVKKCMDAKVHDVKASKRLKESPACVTANRYGWSGHMEKVMKSQPLQESQMLMFASLPKTFELNMEHPIVQSIRARFEKDETSEDLAKDVKTLYNISLLQSGYTPEDANTFCKTLFDLLKAKAH